MTTETFLFYPSTKYNVHNLPDYTPFFQILWQGRPPFEKCEIFEFFDWLSGTPCLG